MNAVQLNPPTERECTRCGRRDVWDNQDGGWVIEQVEGEPASGSPFCIHEWDINGTHNPILE